MTGSVFRRKGKVVTMDVTLVYKVIGIGLIVMFSGMVLDRADRKEQSVLISLSGIVAVLLMLVDKLAELFQKIKFIFGL
ncbi:MAG: stage III sporulation protein AC [Clostridia bacterium]|nr:stage III sporulation protein AC [Clostridia bacterium]